MLRAVDLAVELSSLGARFVVVGSTARRLTSRPAVPDPRDLDLVVAPDDVALLVDAVRAVGGDLTVAQLVRCAVVHVDTAWGPLDVFVAPRPSSVGVRLDGAVLEVAA